MNNLQPVNNISASIAGLCLALHFAISGCGLLQRDDTPPNEPVARVYNKYLYKTDLAGLTGENTSKADSIELVNHYIDQWIRKNVVLEAARRQMPAGMPEVEKKLQDYREMLLMFLYEQKLVETSLDSVVSDEELRQYYESQKESFELTENVLKARFVILKNESPQMDSIRTWFRSQVPAFRKRLEDYCFQYALGFSLQPKWYSYHDFTNEIPLEAQNEAEISQFLKNNLFYETHDAVNTYLVQITDYGEKGNPAPMDYRRHDISKIVVNKRKLEYIKRYKDKLYEEALDNNQFETY